MIITLNTGRQFGWLSQPADCPGKEQQPMQFDPQESHERLQGVALSFRGVTKNSIQGNRRTRIAGVAGHALKKITLFDPNRHHVRQIDWPRTYTDPDQNIYARLYEEPREVKIQTIVNVTGFNFISQWRPKVCEGACALGCLMMSGAETHDPVGLIACSDWRIMEELRPAPMSKIMEEAVETIYSMSALSAQEQQSQDIVGYAGMEAAIQLLPRNPAIVTLVMGVQPDDSHKKRGGELTSQERLWQVIGGAKDAGHDVRCILIVDPIEEQLPGRGVNTYRFADGQAIVTTASCRRQWQDNFQRALSRQTALMTAQSVPFVVMRTSDSDEKTLNALIEISEGF